MSSALIQTSFSSSTTILIALIILVLAVGLMLFLFARSTVQRRERETRVRERMLQMEREANFATAADQVPISRNSADVARQIARLLKSMLEFVRQLRRAPRRQQRNLLDGADQIRN